jgi:hypothetical protein
VGDNKKDARGKLVLITLKIPISFNDGLIKRALIELDHINFGLNEKTGNLKKERRTNFSVSEVEQFIHLLDQEQVAATRYKGTKSYFVLKVDCPVKGLHYGRMFVMVIEHDYKNFELLNIITLYPGWKS